MHKIYDVPEAAYIVIPLNTIIKWKHFNDLNKFIFFCYISSCELIVCMYNSSYKKRTSLE